MNWTLSELKTAAFGRWPEIHAALGVGREYLNPRKHCPCPYCGGKDRYRYTDYGGNGGFICNRCTPQGGSGFDLLMLVFGYDFHTAAQEVAVLLGFSDGRAGRYAPRLPLPPKPPEMPAKDKQAALLYRWHEATEITPESAAAVYLAARGLSLHTKGFQAAFAEPDTRSGAIQPRGCFPLRNTQCAYWTNHEAARAQFIGHFPAMLAAITAPNGELMGLHQTYLQYGQTADGAETFRKLALPCPITGGTLAAKKMYARRAGALKGAAVRFAPPDEQGRLIVAEGIETALAATELFGLPAAAALSAGGVAAFEWPSETRKLYICADNDPNRVGEQAAYALSRRAVKAGLAVHLWQPETQGFDALDELNRRKKEQQR